ncbi:lycopene cyclase domain-containing protein [Haloferax chudinovii]|uniref:Lycopene cyclase domain-containing protein n=1 Tax=Haloferax chudinovii TaxID=1109010 RepID=A0ABD5XFV2_9EURY
MSSTFTYVDFHIVFVLPPLAALAAVTAWLRSDATSAWWLSRFGGLGVISAVALAYATPWDNYLISQGVWWYGTDTVAATVWFAPGEEYLFMLFQPVGVALWLFVLPGSDRVANVRVARRERLAGVLAGVFVSLLGLALLGGRTYYLGAILAWAGPVLTLQWGFGWPYLWARRRLVAVAVAVPTAYLWVADWTALRLGVWSISPAHTTGVGLFGLPVEEALFFVVTNLFVVQGLVLFFWVVERWT